MNLKTNIYIILLMILMVSVTYNTVQYFEPPSMIIVDKGIDPFFKPTTTYNPDNDILYPVCKPGKFDTYTNLEVRQGIKYTARYGDSPSALNHDHYSVFCMWEDYESRVMNASYLFWVVSYAFNI